MPGAKRQRLSDVGSWLHTGAISTVGLAELIKKIADSPTDASSVTRRTLQLANYDVFDRHRLKINLPMVDGTEFGWEIVNPLTWWPELVSRSPELQSVFSTALARHPVSVRQPWHLVVGFDEFAPGNKLRVDNRRQRSHQFTGMHASYRSQVESSGDGRPTCELQLATMALSRRDRCCEAKVHGGVADLFRIGAGGHYVRARLDYTSGLTSV